MLSATDALVAIALIYSITAVCIAHMRFNTECYKSEQKNKRKQNKQNSSY